MKNILLTFCLLVCCAAQAQRTNVSNGQVVGNGTNFSNVVSSGGGGGDTIWLSASGFGSTRNNFDGTVGCKFTVGATAITVTTLGGWTVSGSTQTHRIAIWNSGFTKLGEVSLNKTGLSVGFNYVTLGSPVTLTTGTYYVGEEEFASGDAFYNDSAVTVSTTGVATIIASSYAGGAYDAPFNVNTLGVNSFGPVNFKYHL